LKPLFKFMPLSKEKKKLQIEELERKMKEQKIVLLFDFAKVKTEKMNLLRKKIKELGGEIKVFKKTLAKIVFKKLNLPFDFDSFKGQLAFLFGFQDEILPLKAFGQIEKEEENIKILGGFLKTDFLSIEKIKELENLPSKSETLGRLVFALSWPILGLRKVLSGNLEKFVFVLSQIKVKKEQ